MSENKLTPEEIKKALECCKPYTDEGCLKCPLANVFLPECAEILSKESVDLINRQHEEREAMLEDLQFRTNQVIEQQAEIERLQNDLAISRKETKRYATRRAEAIKEFIEKLKDLSYESDLYDRNERWVKAVTVEEIDETYKEMRL